MPLMSEGKAGPKPAKLRAIWRTERQKRDELAAIHAAKRSRGLPVSSLSLETLTLIEDWLAGRKFPVGITQVAWAATCEEMNRREASP